MRCTSGSASSRSSAAGSVTRAFGAVAPAPTSSAGRARSPRAQAELPAQALGRSRDGVDEQGQARVVGPPCLDRRAPDPGQLVGGTARAFLGVRRGLAGPVALAPQLRHLGAQPALARVPRGPQLGGLVLGAPHPRALLAEAGAELRDLVAVLLGGGLDRGAGLLAVRGEPPHLALELLDLRDRGVALGAGARGVGAFPQVADQDRALVPALEHGHGRGVHRVGDLRAPPCGLLLGPPADDGRGEALGAPQRREQRPRTGPGPLRRREAGHRAHRRGQVGDGHVPDGHGGELGHLGPHGLGRALEELDADGGPGGLVGPVGLVPGGGRGGCPRRRTVATGLHDRPG
ncbi:hypothetical protein [Actinomycetospora sp. CA-053990]|uniref:hypothetical protein n=1 Tax=Actinomycetospora sp. CA-053990 TaxID=3239891 RepID=UPI003D922F68